MSLVLSRGSRRRRLPSAFGALLLAGATLVAVAPAAQAVTVPGAPEIGYGYGASADSSIDITWSAPASDGGSPITAYTVTPSVGSPVTVSGSTYDYSFTGLDANTDYTFTVKATNASGTGPNSAASSPRSPIDVATAPPSVTAVPGNGQATVTWTRPHTGQWVYYRIQVYDGSGTFVKNAAGGGKTSESVGTLSAVVTGLTNGSSYKFKVDTSMWYDYAQGPQSAFSNTVTPATVPGAPYVGYGYGTTSGGQLQATWSPPDSDGNSPITSYTVHLSNGASATVDGSTYAYDFTGLDANTDYTFYVTAANAMGTGASSAASTKRSPIDVATAPPSVTAVPGNGQATVTWTRPHIGQWVYYRIQVYDASGTFVKNAAGGGKTSESTGTLSAVVTGLTNGTSYKFKVDTSMWYDYAQGPQSAFSNTVIPGVVPGAPEVGYGYGTTSGGQLQATWSPPASDGYSPITSYTVTLSNGTSATVDGSTYAYDFTGLDANTDYTFTVKATNALGTGPSSATSSPRSPIDVATAPPSVTAVTGTSGQATVTWTRPHTGQWVYYRIQVYDADGNFVKNASAGGKTSESTGTLSAVVTGLTNGSSYKFKVDTSMWYDYAQGPQSSFSNTVVVGSLPGAPDIGYGFGASADSSIQATWSAPASDGGAAITGYLVTLSNGTSVTTGAGATAYSFTGLDANTDYTYTVKAINGVGTGPASAASSPRSPIDVATAPPSVTAVAGNGQATVTWTRPHTGQWVYYRIQVYDASGTFVKNASGGGKTSESTGTLSAVVTGLTNGTGYKFKVDTSMWYDSAQGPQSAFSNTVTPTT